MTDTAVHAVLRQDDDLADLYEDAPCGLLSTTSDGSILRINRTLVRWLGYRGSELLGQSFDRLLGMGSHLFFQTRCLPVLRMHGELSEVALQMRRADGGSVEVLVNLVVRREPDAAIRVIRVAVFDVTGQQAFRRDVLSAERAAEESERRAKVLREASTTFGLANSVRCLATRLAEAAGTAFHAADTAVLVLTDDGSALELAAGRHHAGDLLALADAGPEATALRRGEVLTIGDLDAADQVRPGLADALSTARFAAMSVIPLQQDGTPMGVLVSYFGRPRSFTDEELELGRELAQQAAVALQHIQVENQLSHRALHDRLTGLANRDLVLLELTAALDEAESTRRPMALIFLDLDGFKQVNDEHGHLVGDAVLVATATRLLRAVRGDDIVARIGGDEFLIVCRDVDSSIAMTVADRIRMSVKQPVVDGDGRFSVTGSVGVAVHRPTGRTPPDAATLIATADAAMYRSKAGGKDHATLVDLSVGA